MSISMYQVSAPVCARALRNLAHVLKKGQAHAAEHGADEQALLQTRLIFDMLPLVRQVQIATDMAARGCARLAGVEPKSVEDTETRFEELYARIDAAIDYVESFRPEQIDGSESRTIKLSLRSGELEFTGQDYLLQFVLPNLYFHCSTAYAILREAGVRIGKADFLGGS